VPEIVDNSHPADIIAARDGWLVDLNVIAGQSAFQEGDGVLAGETVISHLLTNLKKDGSGEIVSTQSVRARGEVWAMTEHTLSASTPLSALAPAPEQKPQHRYALEFLGRRLNFYGNSSNRDKECAKIAILYPLKLPDGQRLPFGWWQLGWQSWQPVGVNADSAEQYLKDTLTRRLESALGDGKILNQRWSTQQKDGAVIVTLEAGCLEQIGMTVDVPDS
jgi:similar to stage IV sporulation protein